MPCVALLTKLACSAFLLNASCFWSLKPLYLDISLHIELDQDLDFHLELNLDLNSDIELDLNLDHDLVLDLSLHVDLGLPGTRSRFMPRSNYKSR